MKKNPMLRTILLSTVFALMAVVLLAPTASAHTAASAHRAATAASRVAHIPNVNIITKDGRSEFSESTLECQFQDTMTPCFKITNRTHKAQEVDNEQNSFTLQPGQFASLIPASGPGRYVLTLAVNDNATLTVTAS